MPRGYPGTMAPHGTLTRYTSHACRCDECRTSMRDYRRRVYGQRPREVVDAERAAKHGSEAMYKNGCRCDVCREGAAAARRARRHANPEATRAYDRARWPNRKKAA